MKNSENAGGEVHEREKKWHSSDRVKMRSEEIASFYSDDIVGEAQSFFYSLFRDLRDQDVLEIGCGRGATFVPVLNLGARSIVGIEISPDMVREAHEMIRRKQIESVATVLEMNGEHLRFADKSFDLVTGLGILHHLDIKQTMAEVQRVLRPGGRAIFLEPMGINPFLNLWRKMTPHLRTPDEHPLVYKDMQFLRGRFDVLERYFICLKLFAIVLNRIGLGSTKLGGILEAMDRIVLRVPGLRLLSWIVVMELKSS